MTAIDEGERLPGGVQAGVAQGNEAFKGDEPRRSSAWAIPRISRTEGNGLAPADSDRLRARIN